MRFRFSENFLLLDGSLTCLHLRVHFGKSGILESAYGCLEMEKKKMIIKHPKITMRHNQMKTKNLNRPPPKKKDIGENK